MTTHFDPDAETLRLKQHLARRKKIKRYGVSRLDKYRHEVLALRKSGSTLEAIQLWLKEKRIPAEVSTISRWLKKNGPVQ